MDKQKQELKQLFTDFRLNAMACSLDQIVAEAQSQGIGYLELLSRLLKTEQKHRQQKDQDG
ncbi:P-loop NTPase family protein [Elizabethkingia anophelis]|uniref:hypothetical protein n=1 Tax=Elizabethkingia anophelis TaxID=1117645 RepID=UPI001C877740|nr:hypothetical protein [Elizabethkingia anophelis]